MSKSTSAEHSNPNSPSVQNVLNSRSRHFFANAKVKLFCQSCLKPCKDEAIKFADKYYHVQCFSCKECGACLSTLDFYTKNEDVYCQADYRRLFGSKCKTCQEYIEGEVITALEFVFHKSCFACSLCSKVLKAGSKVTFMNKNFLCSHCFDENVPDREKLDINNENEIEAIEVLDGSDKEKKPNTPKIGTESPQPGFGKFYNLSYLEHNISPIKKGPSINTSESSPKHYHRPDNFSYTRVARDFINPPKRGILLSDLDSELAMIASRSSSSRPQSRMISIAPMSNKEAVRLAKLPDAQLRSKMEAMPDVISESEPPGAAGNVDADEKDLKSRSEKRDKEKVDIDGKQCSGDDSERDKDKEDADSGGVGHDDDDDENVEGAVGHNDFAKDLDPMTGLRRLRSNPASTVYGTLGSMRSSLLDVLKKEEPVIIYPYEELRFSNFRLPFGVERNSVERHLSKEEFGKLFRMGQKDFYGLPEWKRNDLKKRLDLF